MKYPVFMRFFVILAFSCLVLFAPLSNVFAAACGLQTSNPQPIPQSGSTTFTLNTDGYGKTGGYWFLKFDCPNAIDQWSGGLQPDANKNISATTTTCAADHANNTRYIEQWWSPNPTHFGAEKQCVTTYSIADAPTTSSCSVSISPSNPSTQDAIMATVRFTGTEAKTVHEQTAGSVFSNSLGVAVNDKSYPVTKTGIGDYVVWVENSTGVNICKANFRVGSPGEAGGSNDQSLSNICNAVKDGGAKSKCIDCVTSSGAWTAIGCIETSPQGLFNKFFTLGVGLAGGVAFLLILFGGFQILTSAGNPEQLNAGRELVTSAITGLLLIIFSVFILRLIGVNILGIPGFG